jgi:hypothetical protein
MGEEYALLMIFERQQIVRRVEPLSRSAHAIAERSLGSRGAMRSSDIADRQTGAHRRCVALVSSPSDH